MASLLNPWSTEIFNSNFHSFEVVSRYRDTQLQVTENVPDLQNLRPNIYQFSKIGSTFYFKKLVIQVLIEGQDVYCIRHQCAKG